MTCENCGLPEGAYSKPGYKLTLDFMPAIGEKWHRQGRRSVWVCGSQCAIQTMFIAAFAKRKTVGPGKDGVVHWPMTLKQFTSQMDKAGKLDFLKAPKRGLTVTKPIDETRINIEFKDGELAKVISQATEGGLVTKSGLLTKSKGGRPKVSEAPLSAAEKMRRYRNARRDHHA